MEPLSARVPSDLYFWLSQLQVEGAATNSDKLRVLLGQLKRQHDGAFDYVTAHAWTRDLTSRLRESLVRVENDSGQHSEVVSLLLDHFVGALALAISQAPADADEARKFEEALVRRATALSETLLRQGTPLTASAYDPQVVRRHLGSTLALAHPCNPLRSRKATEMTDSLKTRVGRVIAGGVHALLDRLEDQAPEATMEQSIREADAVIDDVRHELGTVSANRHLSQRQHANLNQLHASLSSQIDEAMTAGREDLARAAVARQLDIEAQLPVLETTLAEHARQENELTGFVAALLAKKREMQDALAEFRRSRAAAAATVAAPAGAASAAHRIGKVTDAFDRVYERQTGLAGTARQNSLQQAAQLKELDDLVRDNKIAERMAQLKATKS
ncbi:PspA/IM30 family protein [Roseateles chitinivorans]|uniref:PspA/IM30 family protein n=1 Tax=Roseateles chitinivorans TaxID=2917965 RepID=UPI003D66ABD7